MLSALLLHPESSLHVRELARLTKASAGSLHRELRLLAELGLLNRQEIGRQVHYSANTDSPVFEELAGLLRKTAGVADQVRDALSNLGRKVQLAFIYGSVAAGTEKPGSDVDLMTLGSAKFADLALALAPLHESLRREVNPTNMRPQDFARRLSEGDGFARSVMAGRRLWLIGDEDDLGKLVAHRKAEAA
ncbi:MAG TPA: nucleotidyltransferase domain-containing protein [Burkholderiaceae bacterium]